MPCHLCRLDGPGIASKLTNANYEVVVFPGGSGSAEYKALGDDGTAAGATQQNSALETE